VGRFASEHLVTLSLFGRASARLRSAESVAARSEEPGRALLSARIGRFAAPTDAGNGRVGPSVVTRSCPRLKQRSARRWPSRTTPTTRRKSCESSVWQCRSLIDDGAGALCLNAAARMTLPDKRFVRGGPRPAPRGARRS
jgi:hypothetical protein